MKKNKMLIKKNTSAALRINSMLCVILSILYLLNVYLSFQIFELLVEITCLICIIICFPFIKRSALVVSSILFLCGALLLITADVDIRFWMTALSKNINLVTLLIIVPIFGMPLYYGGYYEVLDALANKYMHSSNKIYWIPALLTHFFGALMNMGAIPVTYQLIIRGKLSSKMIAVPSAILRGFSSAIYWSPNMVSVALVTHYLNVSWAEFAQVGILFSLTSLLIGWLVYTIPDNKKPEIDFNLSEIKIDAKKLCELVFFCIIFLGFIIYIAITTTLPILTVVPSIALFYPIIWMGLIRKGNQTYAAYRDYISNTLPKFTSEIVIFLAVGFFAASLISSGCSDKISFFIYEFVGVNVFLLCFFILSSVIILAVLGVTPMVTVMAYSAALNPAIIGLSPQLLSLVLVGGWATGIIVSPFTGVTLIMSGLTKRTPFEIARENWLFSAIMVLLLSLVPGLQLL